MSLGLLPLHTKAGMLCSEPVLLSAVAALGSLVLYHHQERSPDSIIVLFTNIVADNGYVPGEEIPVPANALNGNGANTWPVSCLPGEVVLWTSGSGTNELPLKTNPATVFAATNTSWLIALKANWLPELNPL